MPPQGWRLITVVVQIRVVQIHAAAAVKGLTKKKERQDETQLITKIDGFLSSTQLNANLFLF
jgi:hypothetical protein